MSDKATAARPPLKRRKREAVAWDILRDVSAMERFASGFSDVNDVAGRWRLVRDLAAQIKPLLLAEMCEWDRAYYEKDRL